MEPKMQHALFLYTVHHGTSEGIRAHQGTSLQTDVYLMSVDCAEEAKEA